MKQRIFAADYKAKFVNLLFLICIVCIRLEMYDRIGNKLLRISNDFYLFIHIIFLLENKKWLI